MATAASRRGGSSRATRPRRVSPDSASSLVRGGWSGSISRRATARTRRPRAASSWSASRAPSECVHSGKIASGAPFTSTCPSTTTDIRRRRASNGKRVLPANMPASTSRSAPTLQASASRAASIGSPWATHRPSRSVTRPVEHCLATCAVSRNASTTSGGVQCTSATGSYPRPSMTARPPGIQTSTTIIWFWVRVPVLSVQMNVVEPSVSTASRCRTRALRAAMRWAPTASDIVTVGSSPQGTTATVTPTAKRNPSEAAVPVISAAAKNTTPTATATAAMIRETRSSSSRNGLRGGRCSWLRPAMPASRVPEPVATTVACASPSTTKQPAKTVPPGDGCSGTLSPVSAELSTARAWTTSSRTSADTRSPSPSSTRSPRTSSSAAISVGCPSRTTVARRGSRSRSRSAAWAARSSWMKANTPLRTITTKTATPSWGRPAMKASAPATQKSRAKKWTISARSRRHAGVTGGTGSRLGPSVARRAAASPAVRPVPLTVSSDTNRWLPLLVLLPTDPAHRDRDHQRRRPGRDHHGRCHQGDDFGKSHARCPSVGHSWSSLSRRRLRLTRYRTSCRGRGGRRRWSDSRR